jgi:hypothetical protein
MTYFLGSTKQFAKMLGQLDQWLEAALAYAESKSFDPSVLLASRLAPDQYALARQIQAACDAAKFGAARTAGRDAPKHPDTEQTVDELRARIRAVIDYLGAFTDADFEGAEARPVALPFIPGMILDGRDYLTELAIPNFYFHLMTAYAILRHNGVALGKTSYIGDLSVRPG